MTDVHGSIWGGGTHVPCTYQKPAYHSLDPGEWTPPHTSKLHERDKKAGLHNG